LAREQKILIDRGLNPVEVRAEQKQELARAREKRKSFKDCAEMYLEHRLKSLSNDKHKQQWRNTLETYVYPIIGDRPVADISIHEIKNLLEQETQKRNGPTNVQASKLKELELALQCRTVLRHLNSKCGAEA